MCVGGCVWNKYNPLINMLCGNFEFTVHSTKKTCTKDLCIADVAQQIASYNS